MRTAFLSFLICLSTMSSAATLWQRPVFNFSRHTYMAANQNWMLGQADNGWMYFANNHGLLEFDGVFWNTYPIDNDTKLRSLKITNQRIYVGGLGQFGYFEPDNYGRLQYTCLSKEMEKEGIINIWNIHTLGNRVYFQADGAVYYLENGRVGKITCQKGITTSAVIYNCLYTATSDGIYILKDDRFVKVDGIELSQDVYIVALLPYNGNMLIVTSDHGLFIYQQGKLSQWQHPANALIANNKLTNAAINERHIALGTTYNGIILIDTRSNHVENISKDDGLQNKTVLGTCFDRDGNLWLGLDNGIDHVVLTSPLFFLNNQLSAIGSGYASAMYHGNLFMGTNQGLYQTNGSLNGDARPTPAFIDGTGGQVHGITVYDDKLFCGGRNFYVMIDGNRVSRFPIRGIWHTSAINAQQDVLLLGDYWGLKVLRKTNGQWTYTNKIEGTSISAKTMMPEESGNAVWVANKTKGLYRLTLDDALTRVVSTKQFNSPQLPTGNNVCVATIDHTVVIASKQGLFRYNATKDEIEPYTQLEQQLNGKTDYSFIWQDEQQNIWYVCDRILYILHFNPNRNAYYKNKGEAYLSDELIDDFEHVMVKTPGQAVIGTQEGFALLNYGSKQTSHSPLTLQIRHVVSTNGTDTLIYGSSFCGESHPLRIAYKHNSLRIEYSANNFDKSQTVLYSYRMLGMPEEEWSNYSRQHVKEYTNLREGKYIFQVRIVTDSDDKPIIASLSIRVLPPWYRSWWAYVIYALLLAGIIYAVINRLRKNTKELNQKIEILEDEKTRIELQSKQNELMLSRMNVVRKNEMLQEIKKTAVSLNNSLSEENLPNIKRKMVRLIGQIDTNIEHDDDLEAFKGDFDAVHSDFFKILSERFPQLTHKDKMLCAYLKMNMISKEIAPLLNISVRGVEISRYRLRKKLGLDEKDNLTEFLQRIAGE